MTNAPTNSAMPPKTSSAVRKKPKSFARSLRLLLGVVRAGADGRRLAGSAPATPTLRSCGATPLRRRPRSSRACPRLPVSAWAVGSVTIATASAAERRASPKRATPTSVKAAGALSPTILTCRRAGRRSRRTSSGRGRSRPACAARGPDEAKLLERRGLQRRDEAWLPTGSPSGLRIGRRRRRAGVPTRRRRPHAPSPAALVEQRRIGGEVCVDLARGDDTSVPVLACAKTSVNERLIVSVKMYVPAIIATPSTTASAVRAVRSGRARRPRRATRLTPPRCFMTSRIVVGEVPAAPSWATRPSSSTIRRSA